MTESEDGPRVTVIIPARNEVQWIQRCLDHVGNQDFPLADVEVVVVDGGSTDGTAEAARAHDVAAKVSRFVVIEGEGAGTTPANLNVGLAHARGALICRIDARSLVPPSYISRCAALLSSEPDVVVAGGRQVAVARDDSAKAVGIARALNNRFAMGLSRYRRSVVSGPADTVYLGTFRRRQLQEQGGWNEQFPTNQDFELNRRMARLGTIYVCGDLAVGYVPRSTVTQLFRQYQRFGEWKAYYWIVSGDPPRPRQLVLLAAPLLALAALMRLRVPRAAAIAAAGLAVVETVGSQGPPGSVRARVYAAAAVLAVATGWPIGVAVGLGSRARGQTRSAHPTP